VVAVMIGIDPPKRSNTAVVLDPSEKVLARQRFTNDSAGYKELKAFARPWKQRTWAVEGARSVGLSLAQRLAMEGEHVLAVPAFWSARVRALGGGSGRRTDDSDAYAIAVAGLRGHDLQCVLPEDDVAVLNLLSDRRQQLVEQRIAAVNRLHDAASKALQILAEIRPADAVTRTRKKIAEQHAQDVAELNLKAKALAKCVAGRQPVHWAKPVGGGAIAGSHQWLARPRRSRRGLQGSKPQPAGLEKGGCTRWREVLGAYALRADERRLLEACCRTVDTLARLETALQVTPLTVAGSMGQLREHPLLAEARQQRVVLARLLTQLKLPDEGDLALTRQGTRSTQARAAAHRRWSA
jgi:transposase